MRHVFQIEILDGDVMRLYEDEIRVNDHKAISMRSQNKRKKKHTICIARNKTKNQLSTLDLTLFVLNYNCRRRTKKVSTAKKKE